MQSLATMPACMIWWGGQWARPRRIRWSTHSMIELCSGCSACCFGSNAVIRSARFWQTDKSADYRMLRQRHRVWMDHAVRKSGGKKAVRPSMVGTFGCLQKWWENCQDPFKTSGCSPACLSCLLKLKGVVQVGCHTTTESTGASPECLQPEDGGEPWGIDHSNAFHQEVDDERNTAGSSISYCKLIELVIALLQMGVSLVPPRPCRWCSFPLLVVEFSSDQWWIAIQDGEKSIEIQCPVTR